MRRLLATAFAVCVTWSGIATADLVSFSFFGTLDDPYGTTPAGTAYQGSVEYDADTVASFIGNNGFEPTLYPSDSLKITLSIGGESVMGLGGGISMDVGNDGEFNSPGETDDLFNVVIANLAGDTVTGSIGGVAVGWIQLRFLDSSASMFANESLPTSPAFFGADTRSLWLAEEDTAFGLSSASVNPVPLPGAFVLFAGAVSVLFMRRRKPA
ncbi:MAG: hypothetical protein AAF493_28390 [Pseudomonadota bacterium]